MNVRAFANRCREIRNGSPNAFYALVDAFCCEVETCELTDRQKMHTLIAEIRRCLDTDKMLRAYEKLDALDDLLKSATPQE